MSDLWGLHIAGNPTYDDFMQSVNTRPTGPQTLHRGVGLLKDYLDPDLHERLHRAVTTGQPDPDLIHHVLHHVDREGQGMGEYWSALPEDATSYSLTAALPGQDMTQPGYMIRKAPADYHVLISSDWDGQGGQVAHPDQDDNVYKLNPGSGLKVRSVKVRRGGRSGKDWSDWVDLGGDIADGIRYAHVVEADVAEDLMRLAMPAIDAYDDDDEEYNVPRAERVDHQDVQPGPYFHGTSHDLPEGHILLPRRDLGMSENPLTPGHDNWVWMSKTPDDARYHAGGQAHIYEVEPLDEGPWKWNKHPDWDDTEDGGNRYVSPRVRIIRKVNGHRIAMPAPMPSGITFHYHSTNDTIPTQPWPADPSQLVPRFSAPAAEARHNGKTVGFLEYDPPLHATTVNGIQYGDHPPEVSMIKVHPDYRRHGIGTALFDFAKQHQGDLEHSDSRTELGKKWVDYEQGRKTAMPNPLPKGVFFRYHPELMWSPGVTAHLPGGKQVGSLEWYDDDHVMVDLGTRKPGEIDRIGVHPDHQGNSIASSMFDFAKQYEPRLHHSDQLTDDGRGWSEYEKSRNARLAMAWQDWAPKIQNTYGGCDAGQCRQVHPTDNVSNYHIDHRLDDPEDEQSYLRYSHETGPDGQPTLSIRQIYTSDKRRQDGVAEALIRRLINDHPGHKIDPGRMTSSGQAFHDRILDKEPDARSVVTAGRNGPPPPMTFEPFNTMWSNGIMARHAEDGRPLAHLHWYPDGEIESIRVHPEMQGRDIGKHILAHAAMNPDTYEAPHWGIQPSNHMTEAGRAYARSLGYNPPDDEVTPADNDVNQWGWTAVKDYVPLHVPYTGQNEDEMSKHLDQPWTPPTKTASAGDEGWPVWWRGKHRPAGPFDKRWHPNHPEHVPAPWDQ